MTRRPLIAGNWKMFKTGPEAVDTATHIAKACADVRDVDIMIAPAYVCLPLVAEALAGTPVHLGAQNLHFENQGAFTGEISADMLKAAGAEYVIIGHSERRQYFDETDETVNKKSGPPPIKDSNRFCASVRQMRKERRETPFNP